MRMNIDTNKGQLSGGDIHNTQDITGNGNIMVGGNVTITFPGDIHLHLTLPDAETLAALTELLKLATGGKQKSSH